MAKYDPNELIELCNKIDLLEYASKELDFKPRGNGSYSCSCPKHIDVTPSLFITPSKNLYHCMSCGIGGNIINWMMDFENLSFNEAVEKLTQLVGVDIKQLKQCETVSIFKAVNRLYEPNKKANDVPRIVLPEYFIDRYKDEAPQEWIDEGIEPAIMKKYNVRIDERSNRIVYPLYDKDLNLIAFKGRTRFKNYKAMDLQKYQTYQKIGTTDFFVGMKENRDSIIRNNKVIIFEGIKSGMKVESWGFDYWLSSETSWLNDEQIRILVELQVKEVVIAYDNDVTLSKIKECAKKLARFTNVYVVLDRSNRFNRLLPEDKMSPCDMGQEIWETLYSERVKI